MPDEPNEEDQGRASRAGIAKVKTAALKRGLAKEKNQLCAQKKEYVSMHQTAPEELTRFLNDPETFKEILKAAEKDPKAMLVRR